MISPRSMKNGPRILKFVPDQLNHSLNIVHPLCLISSEFIRRWLFCWLHSALLPHSGPFNRILPGIEFSFEHRGSKPHLSFFFFSFFSPPQQICAHFKTNARGESRPTLPWRNKQRACSGFSLIAHAERLVLKKNLSSHQRCINWYQTSFFLKKKKVFQRITRLSSVMCS